MALLCVHCPPSPILPSQTSNICNTSLSSEKQKYEHTETQKQKFVFKTALGITNHDQTASIDAKSEQHEQRAAAIFQPTVLIFGLPTQKYAKIC